jgi:hypothetical protein
MNKGMIMELNKSYAIALNDEGIMEKIVFKKDMEVGQKIFYFEEDIVKATTNKIHRHNNFIKTFGSIAALFLLVFTFFNTMKVDQAYAIVSLDINPSIQIEADSNKKVIKVEGINDDGKNIDFTDVKGLDIDQGIQKIKEKLVEKKYLDTNTEVLVGVAFTTNEDNSSYEETLKDAIRSTFNTEDITYIKADKKEVEEAKTEGISLGRYKAKEAISVDESTKSNISKAPVKEITALIKDKENVIQWDAKDEKNNEAPATKVNSEVKNENPPANVDSNTNSNANTNLGKDRPITNIPSDTPNSNVDKETGNNSNKPTKNNDILEVEPEPSAVIDKDKNSKPADNSVINIGPSNGTIENNTTSSKIQDETKTNSTLPVEPKTDTVNKDTKK